MSEQSVRQRRSKVRPKSRYVPALDGLRAIAVLAVIAYHMRMTWMPGGLLGVTMFFVLSGYLITGLLLAEFDETGTISLKGFWYRRVRRIVPAVLITVLATATLCTIFDHALLTKMRPDIVPSLLFFNNWWQIFHDVSYFEALGAPSPLAHCWSLSIEEQFYVVWPIALLLTLRAGVKEKTIMRVVVVLAAASAIAMAVMYDPAADPSRVYYGTDTRAFSLLIGALLAFVWPYQRLTGREKINMGPAGSIAFNAVGIAAIVGLIIMCVVTNGFSPFIYRGGLVICSILTAIAIAVMVHPASILSKILSWFPLVWIGKRSYGMYLWHYPLLLLMTPQNLVGEAPWWLRVIQLAVIFVVSALAFTFFEDPIRKGKLREFIVKVHDGAISFPYWLRSHLVPTVLACAFVAVGLVGCATVPDTSVLEDVDALQEQASDPEADPDEEAAAAAAASRYDILMIGDSVAVRAIPQFDAVFPFGHIDAEVNRQMYSAGDVYQWYADQGLVGDVVVFALGTNGVVTDDQINDIVNLVGRDKEIWFVTTRSTTDWMQTTNDAIWAAPGRFTNVHVIDWYSLSGEHGDYFDGDGTHLNELGAQAYVDMVYEAVKDKLPEHTAEELAALQAPAVDETAGESEGEAVDSDATATEDTGTAE